MSTQPGTESIEDLKPDLTEVKASGSVANDGQHPINTIRLPDRTLSDSTEALIQKARPIGRRSISDANKSTTKSIYGEDDNDPHAVEYPAIKRRMKFEIQTRNVVYRGSLRDGELVLGAKLPRKFGPPGAKWLHRGRVGRPESILEEGSALELQSEARGYVEFETSDWHHKWCAIKRRLTEAQDMAARITNEANLLRTTHNYRDGKWRTINFYRFPFNVHHLRRTPGFEQGLRSGEFLVVAVRDSSWMARIQVSESFHLRDFSSYLREHRGHRHASIILHTAKHALQSSMTSSDSTSTVNLLNFLAVIIEHIHATQFMHRMNAADPCNRFNPIVTISRSGREVRVRKRDKLAKEAILLMSRTNFASIHSRLLSKKERTIFGRIVDNGAALEAMGLTRRTPLYKCRWKNDRVKWRVQGQWKDKPLTVHNWLKSIRRPQKRRAGVPADMLSLLSGDSAALGRYPVSIDDEDDERNLVKFEARFTVTGQSRPAKEWLDFAEERFRSSAAKRGDDISFVPEECR